MVIFTVQTTRELTKSAPAMEARLYITWKHDDLRYYMASVKNFLLQDPDHYLEFRKHVRNIIDWGGGKRLEEIRDSLDILLEEGRKTVSEQAKSRPPPSNGSATSSGGKEKSSRSGTRSRSGTEEGEEGGGQGGQ